MRYATHTLPGLVLTDHTFVVPLDYGQPHGERLSVFAREVVATGKGRDELPWLLFLQGGPGFASPRPDANAGWLKRALADYRVLLLDQRGTGRSTPVTHQSLALATASEQAAYLKHFRADAIVQDAELIRRELMGGERWSVLGQSFGGFCAAHYLSAAPDGLREVIFTGGLPPLERGPDEVYRATYRRVLARNQLFYNRYPDDAERVRAIVDYLTTHDVALPNGGRLSPRRFQQLGMDFGASSGFETVHYLLEDAFVEGAGGAELRYAFLRGVEQLQPFETSPIYAVLHEAIYCQEAASRWSAERVRAEYPQFALNADGPVLFTGEMIYPWMFDDFAYLRPLKDVAELLAFTDDWPRLYDVARLRANTVPCVAAVYYDDMYVDRVLSEETAATIAGIKFWITNEYQHNALRADGERLLDRLLGILTGDRG